MINNLFNKAKNILFNNKNSGLSATNVQDAINEISIAKREQLENIQLSASSSEQTITIENYNNYNALYIVFRGGGDRSNGITMYIPKTCYNMSNPFIVNLANAFGTSYVCKSHGHFLDGQITLKMVQLTGWTNMSVAVYGLK